MPLIVIYFLHSTSVLSFYIDVVLTLSNEMNQPVDICDSVHWTFYTRFRKMDYVQIIAYSMNLSFIPHLFGYQFLNKFLVISMYYVIKNVIYWWETFTKHCVNEKNWIIHYR